MSQYKSYTPDRIEELFSNYLIDSFSYSKITSFSRNEKAFEMCYIFGIKPKQSASSVAGTAYHDALEMFFKKLKDGEQLTIADLEIIAFESIDDVKPNKWKLGKTTPTVEECRQDATKKAKQLIHNFYKEVALYLDEIEEILDVEVYCNEFITINGVDIPLPCHAQIDLVFRSKSGKIVIVDHKSKASFTDEDEIALSVGTQAITYVNVYESKTGITANEVWFIENKYSQNRDGKPQLNRFQILIDADSRKLYEAFLYEPLRRMIEAVSNPDYVYLINQSDNFVDKAEIYDFWCKTMIAEVGEFDIIESKKELITQRLRKIRDASLAMINPKVIKHFKEKASEFIRYDISTKDMANTEKIEHVLRTFGVMVNVPHVFDGYSSDTYLLEVSAGSKTSSISSYRLDLASALNAPSVRIPSVLTVHEGKAYLPVEVSKKRTKSLSFNASDLVERKIPIGKDNFGKTIHWDLNNHSTPHALICGATGSGKSVCIESTIEYLKLAGVKRIIILDPKNEFVKYMGSGIEVYSEIIDIENVMIEQVKEMNQHVKDGTKTDTVIIFDEFADAIANSRKGNALDIKEMVQVGNYAPRKGPMGFMMQGEPKMQLQKVGELPSLEESLRVLLQKGRSIGFRVLAALQRASTKIITGDAKNNFGVIICFRVPKKVDSMVVLDESGAEELEGQGDGLIKSPEYAEIKRFQGYYYATTH